MRFVRNPHVIATDLGAELVLLDPRSQQMFGLNATGRRVWQSLDGRPAGELAAVLAAEFDVPAETAARDVSIVLARLRDAGLVHEAEADGG
jgi:hypothetical protein